MRYRPEIDGLRAVAVLPVILFHAGFSTFAGGYVGVDVFFVISGYLITTILIGEREAGTYSLLGFYERRARRILPALFLVLICTIPFAWRWLAPGPFEDYARSQAFAALFVSNIHFLENSSYYDIGSAFRPLLHTWSLAVEEQFYLLFPLVLLPLGAFARPKFAMVFLVLAVLSLALAEWGWRAHPDENFYFTFSRLWEILVGSICAVLLFARPRMKSDILGLLGLLLILYSIFFYTAAVPFPSVYTLVPVVGAALIILFADRGTWTARMLSWAPMVWIGLLSYSAYLWHQPLFAFARIRSVDEPSLWMMAALSVVTLVLAWLTVRYVEAPFRQRTFMPGRYRMLMASTAGITIIACFGFVGTGTEGFPSRIKEVVPGYLTALWEQPNRKGHVIGCDQGVADGAEVLCAAHDPEEPSLTIALLGDSHAEIWLSAFLLPSGINDVRVLRGTSAGCPPILGVYRMNGEMASLNCHTSVQAAAQDALSLNVDVVILGGRWSVYAAGDYEGESAHAALSKTRGTRNVSSDERQEVLLDGLRRTVRFYKEANVPVILMDEAPLQWTNPEEVIARALLMQLPRSTAQTLFQKSFVEKSVSDALQGRIRDKIKDIVLDEGAHFVPVEPHLLKDERYVWLENDKVLYQDRDHLSKNGVELVAMKLFDAIRSVER
ncbi:MAG TPA: acyltransferase family protein [Roseovarius sp.]